MKTSIENRINAFAATIDKVDWSDKRIYGAYMAQTYYYVLHSTRLLAHAASRFELDEHEAHLRFVKHLDEESHHEKLALHDVKALGFSVDEFAELNSTRAFHELQHYYIERYSGWALLGFILALEALAVKKGRDLYEQIAKHHGAKAGTFLKVHASEDIEHLEQAAKLLEHLSEEEFRCVEECLDMSCYLYEKMLEELPKAAYPNKASHGKAA